VEPAKNIIELRQLLAERFPGTRFSVATPLSDLQGPVWPTGISAIDSILAGGLPKAAITELTRTHLTSGSSLLLRKLLRQVHVTGQRVALVDGSDSFAPDCLGTEVLSRLLWVRCEKADQALKAADLLLRDGNVPLVLLDLQLNPTLQLRRVPASIWHRFQRLVETTSALLVVFTSQPMVGGARVRLSLQGRFPLPALLKTEEELLTDLRFKLLRSRERPPESVPNPDVVAVSGVG